MREYFDAELRLLRDAAREFGEAHPDQARLLHLTDSADRDPYIERLLEGMAFLTAHVRERIDESRAAISEQLLARVCPAQIRPYPAVTVLELRPQSWRQGDQHIPAGATVHSRPLAASGLRCPFRLTRELRLHPLQLTALRATEDESGATTLRLELRAHGSTPIARMGLEYLDCFVCADRPLAVSLQALLTDADARIAAASDGGPLQPVPALRFRPLGLEPEGSVLPPEVAGEVGLHLLQDYFGFRERYLFLRLQGLDRLASAEPQERLVIEVTSQRPLPAGYVPSVDHLRLFCVPAINLWPMEAEPLRLDHRRSEYRLTADAANREAVRIHSVRSVQVRGSRSGAVGTPRPLHALRPGEAGRYYHVTRHGHGGEGAETYLQIGPGADEPETLSAEVLACNGELPRRHLDAGDIHRPDAGFPGGIRVRNVMRPTAFQHPPAATGHATRLHGFLAASLGSLADAASLRGLLHLMDWSGRPENRRRIEALTHLEARSLQRFERGELQRGLHLHAEVEESGFLSLADLRLFGDVLHAYLATVAAVNEFIALTVTTQPQQRVLTWPPRTGRSCPL